MSVETVARRYATALADVVTKTNETTSVQNELQIWEQLISGNENLQTVLSNPAISQIDKENVLNNLIEKTRPTKTTANFLRVLLRNNRLTEIREINEKLTSVLEERSGAVSAKITSARSLSDAEQSDLQANLSKLTGRAVSINFDTDETLIGGVVTRIGSTVYDGSVKTQLAELKQQMIGKQ